MFLVALTGNYGMGKSTVLSMFRDFGAVTVDADRIVESLLIEKKVLAKIKELLGNNVFDRGGSLNKKKVADIIFKSAPLRRSLEDILHPLVFKRIKGFADRVNVKDKIVIVAAPLIYERGYDNKFDRTIVVYSKKDVALDRLKRRGVSKKDALLRLKVQLPVKEKMKRADFLIDNNGTLEETMAQVKKIYKQLDELPHSRAVRNQGNVK
jgi:dephospho-CoA kinase